MKPEADSTKLTVVEKERSNSHNADTAIKRSRPLRVAIDILPGVVSGFDRWQKETVDALAVLHKLGQIEQLTAFSFGKRYSRPVWLPDVFDYQVTRWPGRIQWALSNLGIPAEWILDLNNPDVILEMVLQPLPTRLPLVLSVADVSWRSFSEQYRSVFTLQQVTLAEAAIQRSTHILTLSAASQKELIQGGVIAERTTVAYLGVASEFTPVETDACEAIRHKYNLNRRYILYVGGVNERKNVGVLAKAYRHLPNHFELVIAGAPPAEGLDYWGLSYPGIRHLGYLPGEDLPAIYQMAAVFVFPSKLEGFGLPLIESAAMGLPIIAADTQVFREIGGNGVVYFPPDEPQVLADILLTILDGAELQLQLSRAAKSRARMFTKEHYRNSLLSALTAATRSSK